MKELRDGRLNPNLDIRSDDNIPAATTLKHELGSGSGEGRGIRWLLKDGRWRRPYGFVVGFLTFAGTLCALEVETRSPIDKWGREHCFTWLYYVRESAIDSFLGIKRTPSKPFHDSKD